MPERRTGAALGKHAAALAPAQCRRTDARGLDVSPRGLLQNELVQRQIGDRRAQPAVLEFDVLQALHLLDLQPAELLARAVVGHLSYQSGGSRPDRKSVV